MRFIDNYYPRLSYSESAILKIIGYAIFSIFIILFAIAVILFIKTHLIFFIMAFFIIVFIIGSLVLFMSGMD
jgi:hypothetical protein